MKKNNIYNKFAIIAVLISTLFVACYPDQSEEWQAELKTFPAITFTGFSPTSGFPGTEITLTGTNFGDLKQASRINFNGTDVEIGTGIISYTDTEIVVTVPELAGTGPIGLNVWTHETQSNTDFVYIPGVAINSLSTDKAVVGDQISILGSNFGTDPNAISVSFSGVEANIISISNTEVVVEVPNSVSGKVSIFYDNGNRETVGPVFIYLDPSIVFDDFLEANPEFGGSLDRGGTQPSGFWPSTQPNNFIGDREWQINGNDQSGRDWGFVTEGSGELTVGPARGFIYNISDNPTAGYTKPTLLTLEANINMGTFNNNTPPREHRGLLLGYVSEPAIGGNPHVNFHGIIVTPDSEEIYLWDGANTNNTAFNGIEKVAISDFITGYDRNADHHLKLVVDTLTGQLVSFELDGTSFTFNTSPNFSNANTTYMMIGGGSNGGGSRATCYDIRFY